MNWGDAAAVVLRFSKRHWKEILLVSCLGLLYAKTQADFNDLEAAYSTTEQSLRNQLVTLENLHAEELRLRDQAIDDYERRLDELKENYETSVAELDAERSREVEMIADEIVVRKQLTENKAELADKITAAFGFDYAQ